METKIPTRAGIFILAAIATSYAVNVVGARVAFDHGASVATAVAVRAGGTALFLLLLMRLQGVSFALPRPTLVRLLPLGLCVALQSYCLFSAVATIPAAIALLVYGCVPMLFVLLSWATGRERAQLAVLPAFPVALAGLALVLDVGSQPLAQRWAELGAGVMWALAAALVYLVVLYANTYWLKSIDGRVRTFYMTGVTSTAVFAVAGAAGGLALPADWTGWAGLSIVTVCYGGAMIMMFLVLPRLESTRATVALNFEPIALLGLGWVFLGQAVTQTQIAGAFVVVAAIAWLGLLKR